MSRVFFESVTLGVFGVMVLLGVMFWAVGGANRRRGLTGEAEFCPEEAVSAGHPRYSCPGRQDCGRQGRGGPSSLRAIAAPSSAREDTPGLR